MISIFEYNFSYRFISFGYSVLGVLALASAFIAEYVFDLLPCKLCILQRWPYLVMIFLGVIGFALHEKRKLFVSCLLATVACFAYGGYIAVYQVGGEQGWWQLTADCSSMIDPNLSPEEYLAALKAAPKVACDVVKWSMFGISMAGYNAIFSIVMGIFTLGLAIKVWFQKPFDLLV